VAGGENGSSVTRKQDTYYQFGVEACVAVAGTFDKWDATLTFTSSDVSSGVLDITIQADSVDTGSSIDNGKLKGKILRRQAESDDHV
jgi:polyisoprenoid-binding protein YceI